MDLRRKIVSYALDVNIDSRVDKDSLVWSSSSKKYHNSITYGSLIASLTASGNIDQAISTTPEIIDFDTDDSIYGTIIRVGNKFIPTSEGLYSFALQPQVTELSPTNITTMWAILNGNTITNSAIQNRSSGVNDTHVEPLVISMTLVVDDEIEFGIVTSSLAGARLDYTAPSGAVPAIPAIIIDIKGWKI